jgi:hypothetical protein
VALTFEQILAEARKLPPEEQERLAVELQEASDESEAIELAWRDEVVRRVRRVDAGESTVRDAGEAGRELLKKLGY